MLAKTKRSSLAVYVISDSTGDLGSRAVRAGLDQFRTSNVPVERSLFVRSPEKLERAIKEAASRGAYVVYTLVDPVMRDLAARLAHENGISARSLVMSDLVPDLAAYLGQTPSGKPGHKVSEASIAREEREWDAIKFVIEHDDGQRMEDLGSAEAVIVGVSRVRKTQLSKELAFDGYFVANVPLALETGVPTLLLDPQLDPGRVFALTMAAGRLRQIRHKRLERGAPGLDIAYADLDYVRADLAQVDRTARERGWRIIEGTDRGIEEIAAEIEEILKRMPHKAVA